MSGRQGETPQAQALVPGNRQPVDSLYRCGASVGEQG
jgi:hypothetical protein